MNIIIGWKFQIKLGVYSVWKSLIKSHFTKKIYVSSILTIFGVKIQTIEKRKQTAEKRKQTIVRSKQKAAKK